MNAVMNRARQLREGILRTTDARGLSRSIVRRTCVVMQIRMEIVATLEMIASDGVLGQLLGSVHGQIGRAP